MVMINLCIGKDDRSEQCLVAVTLTSPEGYINRRFRAIEIVQFCIQTSEETLLEFPGSASPLQITCLRELHALTPGLYKYLEHRGDEMEGCDLLLDDQLD